MNEGTDLSAPLCIVSTCDFIVTHEMAFAKNVADKIIFMDNGSIIEEGDPIQIFDKSRQERTQLFLNSILIN